MTCSDLKERVRLAGPGERVRQAASVTEIGTNAEEIARKRGRSGPQDANPKGLSLSRKDCLSRGVVKWQGRGQVSQTWLARQAVPSRQDRRCRLPGRALAVDWRDCAAVV